MHNPMLVGQRPFIKRPVRIILNFLVQVDMYNVYSFNVCTYQLFQPDPIEKAPATTVFVGNIHERANNELLKSLLNRCGGVTQWKRVHGSNNRFQAFGFCEFDHPDATLRALRFLNDFNLGGKKLSVNWYIIIDF